MRRIRTSRKKQNGKTVVCEDLEEITGDLRFVVDHLTRKCMLENNDNE